MEFFKTLVGRDRQHARKGRETQQPAKLKKPSQSEKEKEASQFAGCFTQACIYTICILSCVTRKGTILFTLTQKTTGLPLRKLNVHCENVHFILDCSCSFLFCFVCFFTDPPSIDSVCRFAPWSSFYHFWEVTRSEFWRVCCHFFDGIWLFALCDSWKMENKIQTRGNECCTIRFLIPVCVFLPGKRCGRAEKDHSV